MEKVACRTPAKERPGVTKIPKWKFDSVRAAILAAIGTEELAFSDLEAEVRKNLADDDYHRMGSLGWHVTTVKLEMEVRGEIERLPGNGPQRLRRVV